VDHRVLGVALADGLDRRLFDVVGRVEVGLAGAETDDVAAGGLELDRLRGDREGRRGLNARKALGKQGHVESLGSGFGNKATQPRLSRRAAQPWATQLWYALASAGGNC